MARSAGFVLALAVALSLTVCAGDARPAASGQVTISMQISSTGQPGWQVLIPNFERVYPHIAIDVTYASSSILSQLEPVEFGAGNAPDLVASMPGCGNPISICETAKAGYLAPLLKEPWAKRSLPLVTSLDKYGQGLFAFTPAVDPEGVFTNDDLFKKLGLTVPQTFSQLLTVCQKAKAAGTAAIILGGANTVNTGNLVVDLAVATVYGKDKQWAAELRAGKVSFDGTAGWHEALQEFVDMSNAGCFQPGAIGTTSAAQDVEFAQGQGLMLPTLSSFKGTIDGSSPSFSYSFHQFPGGTDPTQTRTFFNLATSVSVNASSSAGNQAAARAFVDFIARPKQNALYTQIIGGLTQYEVLEQQVPAFMPDFAAVLKEHAYIINPEQSWWNPNVLLALQQDVIGLITGQSSIDGVLNAMDAAWKLGPS